jgi:hypothetical protein
LGTNKAHKYERGFFSALPYFVETIFIVYATQGSYYYYHKEYEYIFSPFMHSFIPFLVCVGYVNGNLIMACWLKADEKGCLETSSYGLIQINELIWLPVADGMRKYGNGEKEESCLLNNFECFNGIFEVDHELS